MDGDDKEFWKLSNNFPLTMKLKLEHSIQWKTRSVQNHEIISDSKGNIWIIAKTQKPFVSEQRNGFVS